MLHKTWYGPDPVHVIENVKVPWLWIGAVFPHETVDATTQIDTVVRPGDHVNSDYLSSVTGHTPVVWKYLDTQTLEEKDFPSDGFVIGENEESHERESVNDDST